MLLMMTILVVLLVMTTVWGENQPRTKTPSLRQSARVLPVGGSRGTQCKGGDDAGDTEKGYGGGVDDDDDEDEELATAPFHRRVDLTHASQRGGRSYQVLDFHIMAFSYPTSGPVKR